MNDIITVDELAEYLKLDRKTIYDSVKAGEMPGAQRIGRSIRIHSPTVLAWLERGWLPKPRKKR